MGTQRNRGDEGRPIEDEDVPRSQLLRDKARVVVREFSEWNVSLSKIVSVLTASDVNLSHFSILTVSFHNSSILTSVILVSKF